MNRFDSLAALHDFTEPHVAAIRESLNLLLPRLGELVASFDAALKRSAANREFPGLEGERREQLQSLMASFILRTVNCNFDEAYCEFAREVSTGLNVPRGFFAFGLFAAQDFVCRVLPTVQRDHARLSEMLVAWNRLTAVLTELTRQ
jgi:hypothetical protein